MDIKSDVRACSQLRQVSTLPENQGGKFADFDFIIIMAEESRERLN